MADSNLINLSANTTPVSTDITYMVDDPAGTPADNKVTLGNLVTKAHGLSDGIVKVASGTMAVASSGTDYAPATSGTGVLKGNGSGGFSTATANTDYYAPKAKLDATTAPGSSNDNTQGYAVGSVWVDVTNDKSYIAVDVSTGAAVWNDLTASAGGGINNVVEDLTPQLGGDLDMNTHNITAGAATISPTEVSYLDGVTSAIQTQLNDKITASSTDTLTNKTFDANGTGNALSNVEVADLAATAVVTAAEGLASSDNDTSLPTTAAVIDGLATKQDSGATLTSLEGLTLGAGDMLYATGADTLADLAIGTANQVLRVNAGATAPEWATISSGGQTLVTHIVAASGGTHTTLGAALAAASNGDTIYVREGTYTESAISSALTNITIIGENPVSSIISMGANAFTLSGTDVTFINCGLASTTGIITFSGANKRVINSNITHAAGSGGCVFSGVKGLVQGCRLACTSTGFRQYNFSGAKQVVTGNHFALTNSSSAGTQGAVEFGGDHTNVTGNYIEATTAADIDKPLVGLGNTTASANINFAGNTLVQLAISPWGILAGSGAVLCTITGNSIYGVGYRGIEAFSLNTTISGNSIYMSGNAAGNYGINLEANGCIVTGNNVYGPGTTAEVGIRVGSAIDNSVITGNRVYRFGTAIKVNSSGCDNTVIANNVCDGATTGLSDAGLGSNVYGNIFPDATSMITEKKHVYMKNTSGATINAGNLVTWKAVAAGNEMTTTTTAGDDKVFGICIESTANNAVGRVQILGKNTQATVDGTTDIAVGDPITTFTTAGIGAKAAAGDMVIGYALEAYTGNDSLGVIDILLISPRLI